MTAKISPKIKRARTSLLLCLVLFSACAPLFAQQPQAQQPQGPDPVAENLFPPDLVLSNQKAIGLDDTQRNFIRSEVLKAQTRFTELQFQLQDAMEALGAVLKQDPVDETQALTQLDKVLNAEREIKRTQIALMVRIKNKLTPDQQSRLRQLRTKPGD